MHFNSILADLVLRSGDDDKVDEDAAAGRFPLGASEEEEREKEEEGEEEGFEDADLDVKRSALGYFSSEPKTLSKDVSGTSL